MFNKKSTLLRFSLDNLIGENIFFENVTPYYTSAPKPIEWSYSQKSISNDNIVLSQAHNGTYRFIGFDHWTKDTIDIIKTGEYIYEDYIICKPYIDYEYKCDMSSY